jgi:hypothetical protein
MNYRERIRRIEARIGPRIDDAALDVTCGAMLRSTLGEGGPYDALPDRFWDTVFEGDADISEAVERADTAVEKRGHRKVKHEKSNA